MSAPRSNPYQMKLPSCVRGPCQILRTTSASAAVNVSLLTVVPTNAFGSYVQWKGSSTTPSLTPSLVSQVAIAATVTASSLAFETKFDIENITTSGQRQAGTKRCQLMAGHAEMMPAE